MELAEATTLAARLRYYRLQARLSIGEVARRLGVPRQTISAYEHEVNQPDAARVQSLALVLGCAAGDLYPHDWEPEQRKPHGPRRNHDGRP